MNLTMKRVGTGIGRVVIAALVAQAVVLVSSVAPASAAGSRSSGSAIVIENAVSTQRPGVP